MKKILRIDGMMCGHCENRVKTALEAVPGVAKAEVSHEKGSAVVTLNGKVAEKKLQKVIEAEGYLFLGEGSPDEEK